MKKMKQQKAINLAKKLQLIDQPWQPRVVAELNDIQFKLVKLEGEFDWHQHEHSDEVFYIIEGSIVIELEDDVVHMSPGDLFVVEKGVMHRPVAAESASVLLIEPRGLVNTGDNNQSALTAENDLWI